MVRSLGKASRAAFVGLVISLSFGGDGVAQDKKAAIKGKIQGGDTLLNQVLVEASDPSKHRYTFRIRSTSSGEQAKRPTAHLPKELCIAALKKEGAGAPRGAPVMMGVSGGRTSPVTVVVAEGQAIQFVNHDPFPHKLFDTSGGGLGPEEMKPGASRSWKPPKAGSYEIRDKLFPSVRSWIVVEPRTAQVAFPTLAGDYLMRDLEAGQYELVGYFMGKPTGKPLAIEVKAGKDEQEIKEPLSVGEKKADEKGK
jgi:hypothetical protein